MQKEISKSIFMKNYNFGKHLNICNLISWFPHLQIGGIDESGVPAGKEGDSTGDLRHLAQSLKSGWWHDIKEYIVVGPIGYRPIPGIFNFSFFSAGKRLLL